MLRSMAGSAGVYVTVEDDSGTVHRKQHASHVETKVYTRSDHYLSVRVSDSGEWVLAEVQPAGQPHVIARGRLPSSQYDDDRYDWHG